MLSKNPDPIRLRPVTERSIGTTSFFRNRPLIDTLLSRLKYDAKKTNKILFHACSVGAEVYSLIIRFLLFSYDDEYSIKCYATDREEGFVGFAKSARYPSVALNGMVDGEKRYFSLKEEEISVLPRVRKYVDFLPAHDFTLFNTTNTYDVVFLLNALVYVPESVQRKALARISKYNSRYLVVTGFHGDSIQKDLENNGYCPILENQQAIHDSWLDRRMAIEGDVRSPTIFTDWRLPSFSKIAGYEFKYCAIFEKQN